MPLSIACMEFYIIAVTKPQDITGPKYLIKMRSNGTNAMIQWFNAEGHRQIMTQGQLTF
jgi:hypothetical protein